MAFLEEYTLLDELGQGGFATVYKVRHNELGYIRAVRVLNAVIARGTEDKTYQRFIDECRLLMRLGNGNHPNIVHICRTLLKEQRAAVEMDFVDGASVTSYLKSCNGFAPIDDVMRFMEQMASALAYCHHDIYRFCMDRVEDDLQDDPDDGSKVILDEETIGRLVQKYRVIHNDIHSDNIIRREDGNHVLLDFGLAVQGESVVRSSRRSDGAPEFKAPEKWDSDAELTTQSDVYSFGVVLYEYLTGRPPFPLAPEDAGSAKAIYLLGEAHKYQVPDSIYELRKSACQKACPDLEYNEPDYPQWMEEVVMKCLEKNPQDRFRDGKELYDYIIRKKAEERTVPPVQVENDDPIEIAEAPEEIEESAVPEPSVTHGGRRWKIIAFASIALTVFAAICAVVISLKLSDSNRQYAAMESELTMALDSANKKLEPLGDDHPAIVYLDNNIQFSRQEMESYPELSGLWDALNTYDYEKYASYFVSLQSSETYVQTLMRLRSKRSAVDGFHAEGRKFVADDEGELKLLRYLFTLLRDDNDRY